MRELLRLLCQYNFTQHITLLKKWALHLNLLGIRLQNRILIYGMTLVYRKENEVEEKVSILLTWKNQDIKFLMVLRIKVEVRQKLTHKPEIRSSREPSAVSIKQKRNL